MQVSVETIEGLKRKMTIAIPGDKVDTAVNDRLQNTAKTMQLKGFRKGKVPVKVVKSKFGEGVRQEVVGELMNQGYYDALNQENLKPASQPQIEATKLQEGEDLEFIAIFEVYPEIELPEFSKITVDKLSAEITNTDVDEMIETLRKQRRTWEKIDRAAQEKDMVDIDYLGRKNGEEFEGGRMKGANLELGSGRMIAGFEKGIEGRKAGEVFILNLEFPQQYHSEELAGQAVQFEITLNSVSEQILPEINGEFFLSFGIEEGGEEAFRKEVSNNMSREMNTASRSKFKNKIMDAVIDLVDITVPEALITAEVQQMKNQAIQRMGGGNEADPSMLPDEPFQEQAKRRASLGLVLGEVIQEQNLRANPAKVRESVEELASTYESPDDVINWYYGNKEQLASIESTVLEDQVFDYIIEQANVNDKQVSYQDIMEPESKNDETG